MRFLNGNLYKTFAGLSVIGVFGLFVLGGLVRSTGSGMGCPDWPLCYGKYAPPLSEGELPENYQEVFNQQRLVKVDNLVQLLNTLGMERQAELILASPYLRNGHKFSVVKAYIEYINRLWGVLVGIFVLIMLFFALIKRKELGVKLFWPIFGFLMVLINGWIGSKVVDSNLLGGLVTFHFFFAMVALLALIWSHPYRITFEDAQKPKIWLSLGLSISLFIQMLVGTWVRELVDFQHANGFVFDLHAYKILGHSFSFHRLGFLVSLSLSFLQYRAMGYSRSISFYIMVLIVFQAVNGSLNLFFDFPGFWQASHIFFAALVLSLQLYFFKSTLFLKKHD